MITDQELRETCQRIAQEFLSAHDDISDCLKTGDTLTRYSAFELVRDYVCRKYPSNEMNWYEWEATKPLVVDCVRELCGVRR